MKKNIHMTKSLSKAIIEGDIEAFHKIIAGNISGVNVEELARKLKEPESYWVQLALQDQLNQIGLKLKVSVA